jgi:hypothetical protein
MATRTVSNAPIINSKYQVLVYAAATATGLATAALFSRQEAIRIIGTTVLTGVGYGIINDMMACRDCIEYFTIQHVYNPSERLLHSLDPNLNAVAWGAMATWFPCTVVALC